jgi:hypothetical protein
LVNQIREAGYSMHAICLWAPLCVTRERGEPRSMREGKLWSPDDYALSTQGSLAMALKWAEGMRTEPDSFQSLALWDNTHHPSEEVSLQRFVQVRRRAMHDARVLAAQRCGACSSCAAACHEAAAS